MAMQTLKYEDDGFASVAVDQAGNFVTDDAGNLLIPIEPFYIECTTTNNGCDPDYEGILCDLMRVTLPDRTVSYYLCPDEFKNDEIAVFKHVGGRGIIRFNARTLKELYGNSFTMTVDVIADYKSVFEEIIVDGKKQKCENIFGNRGFIRIKWGNNEFFSYTDACSRGGYHTAKFAVNFTDMTISSDTESIEAYNPGEKCDRICYEIGDDDDPYEVTAYCDVALCSDTEPGVYRSRSGYHGDWLFSSSKVTVTVHPDRGETPKSELQKAAICSVINEDYRKYIVTSSIDPKRYYRDKEKDVTSGYQAVRVVRGTVAGRSNEYGDYIWIEHVYGESTQLNGKRVFSDASPSADIDDSEKAKYTTDKLKIGMTEWVTPFPDEYPWSLHSATDEAGNLLTEYNGYGYLYPTGDSVTLTPPSSSWGWGQFGFADDFDGKFYEFKTFDDKFTVWWIKYYNLSGGFVAAFPGKPYFGKDEFDFWVMLPETTSARNGAHRRSLSNYHPPVTAVNGVYYDVTDATLTAGYVWENDIAFAAWSLSPCHSGIDTTIYTEKDYGGEVGGFGIGDAYATLLNGTLQWQGTIVASGNALYSVTGSDGITRYWKEDIEVQEEIDEEFE